MKQYIFILLIFLAVECNAQYRTAPKPNIIWIVCEDISPYIGAYGDSEVKTPNIDGLAREGIRYTHAYTTAGVSAPSRSSIITGMYPMSIGTQHMRTGGDPKYQPVPPYSAVIPEYVKCFPEFLRSAGYYCTNNEKQDYQFIPPVTVWDENGPAASFRNRPDGKPFFSVFNFFITHESQLFSRHDSLIVDPDNVSVPLIYPNTKTVRNDIARMLTNIERMDSEVGELLEMLKADDLYGNTIIFFYSDHGGTLPWMKREILERGTHIPLIIRLQGSANAGSINNDLISAVDFAPTVLSLAGISVPSYMQGQAFLGRQKAAMPRKYVFAARDRMDTEYDRVRMVRDQNFRYLYNYYPEKPYYQNIEYRLGIPMMKELLSLRDDGKLDTIQAKWFAVKPVEELYDVRNDPYETHNLAADPGYKDKLNELRGVFKEWSDKMGDLSDISEKEMIHQMWNGNKEAPSTAAPLCTKTDDGILINCATKGASIGYRIIRPGESGKSVSHIVRTWDYGFASGAIKNGTKRIASPVWSVYRGKAIHLEKSDTLQVNAMRIGYKPSVINYIDGKVIPLN
jgi:N-sulfoglucosamine sulfohydrolase